MTSNDGSTALAEIPSEDLDKVEALRVADHVRQRFPRTSTFQQAAGRVLGSHRPGSPS